MQRTDGRRKPRPRTYPGMTTTSTTTTQAAWPLGERTAETYTVADADLDLAPLLAKAGILMFEYDADGILLCATGSCLGAGDPELEVRMGLVTPASVRRATSGQMVVEWIRIEDRTIAVHHEPVRGEDCDHIERVVVTAFDVTDLGRALPEIVTPLHMTGAPAKPRPALHSPSG